MKNLKHKVKYQKGSALLTVVGALSVVGIMTVLVSSNLVVNDESRINKEIDLKVLEYLDKSLSLASYFITNNLVLCRDLDEGSWPTPIRTQCIWGGEKYSLNEDGQTVSLDFYGMSEASEGNDYSLKIPPGHSIFTNRDEYSIKITFKIKDFKTDTSLRRIIGTKNPEFEYLDQDNKVILITANAQYKNKIIGTKKSLIRRPFTTPILSVENTSACNLVCTPGQSHNPNKECRSRNDVPRSFTTVQKRNGTEEIDSAVEGEKHITLTVKNQGPGALYKLIYFKKIQFNKENYPEEEDTIESVDMFTNGENILMPGKTITYEDKIPCLPQSRKTLVYQKKYGGSNSQGSHKVTTSVHKEHYMDLSYGFNFKEQHSDVAPRRLAEETTNTTSSSTRDVSTSTIIQYVIPPH